MKANKTFTKKYSIPVRQSQPLAKDVPRKMKFIKTVKSPTGQTRVKLSSGGIARMQKVRGSQDVTPVPHEDSKDLSRQSNK